MKTSRGMEEEGRNLCWCVERWYNNMWVSKRVAFTNTWEATESLCMCEASYQVQARDGEKEGSFRLRGLGRGHRSQAQLERVKLSAMSTVQALRRESESTSR